MAIKTRATTTLLVDAEPEAFWSHDMFRRQFACARVAQFDLYGRVDYSKLLAKLVIERTEKFVAGMALGHDKVTGQGGLGGAHCPYVQVVDGCDAG